MDPILMLFGQQPRDDWQWTLKPAERAWSRDNALALANCSLLAYSDKDKIIERLKKEHQFDAVIPCNPDHHSTGTEAYVAVRPDAIIVAFRGTEPTNLRDYAADFDVGQIPFETKFPFLGWGRVHKGWAARVAGVLTDVVEALKAHDNGTRSLWITGHSLGGALAMLTAAVLANVQNHPLGGVYTFGQPRVGDPVFRRRYDETLGDITFRCVNDRDPVPHVPPRELTKTERLLIKPSVRNFAEFPEALIHHEESPERYEHTGRLRLLLPNGGMSDKLVDETAREPEFDPRLLTARSLFLELPRLLIESPGRLKDHVPINPITHDGYVDRIEALP